jgi:hypothetical protein
MLECACWRCIYYCNIAIAQIVMAHVYGLIFQELSVSFAGVWDEASDQDGARPSDIAVLLLADGAYCA